MSRELHFLVEQARRNNLYRQSPNLDNRRIKQLNEIKRDNFNDNDERNPYTYIIEKLREQGKGLEIKPEHLAYLENIGVKPPNRMFVLRRFSESNLRGPNADLFNDESYKNQKPVSVITGWIEEDSNIFGDMKFNEQWTTTDNYLHTMIKNILENELGSSTGGKMGGKTLPIRSWSQGILLEFLKASNIISEDVTSTIFGNPNVLQEGAMRQGGGNNSEFTLSSTWNYTFKVTFEAKYIYDRDPVDAMKSLIDNLLSMGSSKEIHFQLGSVGEDISSIMSSTANEIEWGKFKKIFNNFVNGVGNILDDKNNENNEDENKPSGQTNIEERVGVLKNFISDITGSMWNATIAKYRWEMKGVWGVHTGQNTTPWHLTIGNPLSPVLSMNHVIVDDVQLSSSPADGFIYNDIPKKITATITVKNSRNAGIDILSPMFFRNHMRTYDSPEMLETFFDHEKVIDTNESPDIPDDNNKYGRKLDAGSDYTNIEEKPFDESEPKNKKDNEEKQKLNNKTIPSANPNILGTNQNNQNN